jgi:hypothetical protein
LSGEIVACKTFLIGSNKPQNVRGAERNSNLLMEISRANVAGHDEDLPLRSHQLLIDWIVSLIGLTAVTVVIVGGALGVNVVVQGQNVSQLLIGWTVSLIGLTVVTVGQEVQSVNVGALNAVSVGQSEAR